MAKKKVVVETVTAEPIREVALANPQVSNSINLNMNQNDVIDIAIQEQLGILEVQIKQAEDLEKQKTEEFHAAIATLQDGFVKKYTAKNKGFQHFERLIKSEGLKIVRKVNVDKEELDYDDQGDLIMPKGMAAVHDYKPKHLAEYKWFNFHDQYNDRKDPVKAAKRGVRPQVLELRVPTMLKLALEAKGDDGLDIYWESAEIATTDEFRENMIKIMTLLAKELADIKTQVYELNLKYLEYENGDKKIKAQVLKKSLSKSEEGRGILRMLQDATNIKMLG